MSTTNFLRGVTHPNLVEQLWTAALWKFVYKQCLTSKYTGKPGDMDSLIVRKVDLIKEKGDKITVPLMRPITDNGKKNGEAREGQEVPLTFDDFSLEIHEWSQQTRIAGKKAEQSTSIRVREASKVALGDWNARMIDENSFLAMSGLASNNGTFPAVAPSPNRKWKGGQSVADVVEAVATDALIDSSSNNLFGPKILEVVRRKAIMAAAGYSKIRPIKIDGEDWFVAFLHPYQVKALKQSAEWKSAALYADVRGRDNRLFAGSLGAWDKVILHECDFIETRYGAGGTAAEEYFEAGDYCANGMFVARGLFCGAGACAHAIAQYPSMVIKMFEYNTQHGISTDILIGVGKPKFNSEDYGVITMDTAIVAD